ncbi:MAG: hypothetical protein KC546_14670 [Anaerolineae bacterium]|nr:hypothetical protein [Anaerolineae bacterium]MCA9893707.1 hypothetical protein [Anaerolineae bacterium]
MSNIQSMLTYFLERYDVQYEAKDFGILIPFAGEEAYDDYIIIIQLEEPWLRFYIPAIAPRPDATRCLQLMQVQDRLRGARLIVDNSGIGLVYELYVKAGLAYEQFEAALDTLTGTVSLLLPYLFSPAAQVIGAEYVG